MIIRKALIVLLFGTQLIGCTVFQSAGHGGEGAYRIEVFMAEVDERLFHQLGLWEVDQNAPISNIVGAQSEDIVSVIMSSKQYLLNKSAGKGVSPTRAGFFRRMAMRANI